jgi:hypothetical protein
MSVSHTDEALACPDACGITRARRLAEALRSSADR